MKQKLNCFLIMITVGFGGTWRWQHHAEGDILHQVNGTMMEEDPEMVQVEWEWILQMSDGPQQTSRSVLQRPSRWI